MDRIQTDFMGQFNNTNVAYLNLQKYAELGKNKNFPKRVASPIFPHDLHMGNNDSFYLKPLLSGRYWSTSVKTHSSRLQKPGPLQDQTPVSEKQHSNQGKKIKIKV